MDSNANFIFIESETTKKCEFISEKVKTIKINVTDAGFTISGNTYIIRLSVIRFSIESEIFFYPLPVHRLLIYSDSHSFFLFHAMNNRSFFHFKIAVEKRQLFCSWKCAATPNGFQVVFFANKWELNRMTRAKWEREREKNLKCAMQWLMIND